MKISLQNCVREPSLNWQHFRLVLQGGHITELDSKYSTTYDERIHNLADDGGGLGSEYGMGFVRAGLSYQVAHRLSQSIVW